MKIWPFGKKKEAPKQKRAYQGAAYGRLVNDWIAQSTSVDAEIKGSLSALRNRARQLGRDNDYVRAHLRALQNNVVGRGIGFQSHIALPNGEPNEALNQQIESEWKKWTRKENCHVAGKLSFAGLERVTIRTVGESGEVFARLVFQKFGKSRIPLAIQLFEGDQLVDDYNGLAPNGNEIRMGIEHDSWGRPTAYYVRQYHPGDYQYSKSARSTNNPLRIPANEIVPLFVHERIGQTRGVTSLASSIMRLHHMSGVEEGEVISARATAALMGFIESPEDSPADDIQDGQQITDFEPGVFKKLAPGEKVTVPDLHRAGGTYEPFIRTGIRGFSAGVGSSYESNSADFSQSNYSSTRQSLLTERDNWRVIQDWMIENFHQVIFEKWLDMAVLSGVIKIPDYERFPEKYTEVLWMPRGWQWIDPSKDVSASKEAIMAGLDSQTNVLAQQGKDFETVMLQRKREIEFAKKLGIPLDVNEPKITNPTKLNPAPADQSANNEEVA